MVEATERTAEVAIVDVRRVDTGLIEAESERVVRSRGATRPIVGALAGVVQSAIRIDEPATYKEQRSSSKCSIDDLRAILVFFAILGVVIYDLSMLLWG